MEELIQEIILKAYKISSTTDNKIFVNYSGHVNWLDVFYYEDNTFENFRYNKTIYLDRNKEMAIEELKEVKKQLEKLEEK